VSYGLNSISRGQGDISQARKSVFLEFLYNLILPGIYRFDSYFFMVNRLNAAA
jgi:hypothetical protein